MSLPGGDLYNGPLELTAGLSWAGSAWLASIGLTAYLMFGKGKDGAAVTGMLWGFAGAMLFEGISFTLNTFKEYGMYVNGDPPDKYILRTAAWGVSQCLSGGFGLVSALYINKVQLSPRFVWMIGIGSGALLSLLGASLTLMATPESLGLFQMLFLVRRRPLPACTACDMHMHTHIHTCTCTCRCMRMCVSLPRQRALGGALEPGTLQCCC